MRKRKQARRRSVLAAGFLLASGLAITVAQTLATASPRHPQTTTASTQRPASRKILAAEPERDALRSKFETPPPSAHPRVWWHWMNGNISKEGIRLDLAWMHRVGIAGFQTFDAALATPQVVPQRLVYMTPPWQDAFRYAIHLGEQYGMDMGIAGSPGWSESGGPWVPPSEGMKKYVWSETVVEGEKHFVGKLPQPPDETGPFQDIPTLAEWPDGERPKFYADAAVVAYQEPAAIASQAQVPGITASATKLNESMLSDGDYSKATYLSSSNDTAWILFEYREPETIQAITYVFSDPEKSQGRRTASAPTKMLQASDDGVHFRDVAALPPSRTIVNTLSISPTTAKYFRVTFTGPPLTEPGQTGPAGYPVAELALHADPRVTHFAEKAAFVAGPDLYSLPTPDARADTSISKNKVVDVRPFVQSDGTLDWTPPPGTWVVLRIGYSLLGTTNHPATAEATGLEVDKLDHRFVKNYFEHYLDTYRDTVGPSHMGKRGVQNVVSDSWEAGSQNWTDTMIADFKRLRGYDPTPWLPVLTGRVVETAGASDRFLWDLRKTIADLVADEHYGEAEKVMRSRGLVHYGESHEGDRVFIADGMEVKKDDDVPMGAMWVEDLDSNYTRPRFNADDRESASVAHIYGQNLAAAESLTTAHSPWAWSPQTLKATADQEFINGINRIFIHESSHQPLVGKVPGLTLGKYGQWFNRNETWADDAKPWIDYLARCSFLLQQGHYVADILYFYGEDTNITARFGDNGPPIPRGYDYDYVNADALMHALHAASGQLQSKSGMTYRVLVLDPCSRHMSLPVLEAIRKLVFEGGVVVGSKPTDDPSLADNQERFQQLVEELFGDGSGTHRVGKGVVYAGASLDSVLRERSILPDFSYQAQASQAEIEFIHRSLHRSDQKTQIYFLSNRTREAQTISATFRVAGQIPELWVPETGRISAAPFEIRDGQTTVPITLGPSGSIFVLFRRGTTETSEHVPAQELFALRTVNGPWEVRFQPGRGAPPSLSLPHLADWSKSEQRGVRYFSGAAKYTSSVVLPAAWFQKGDHIRIDLGDVRNLAAVAVNGRTLGTAWHAPFALDASNAFHAGKNRIEIRVTNSWVNRLIGDKQPGAVQYTWTDVQPYSAASPLLPSGLLGPVTLTESHAP